MSVKEIQFSSVTSNQLASGLNVLRDTVRLPIGPRARRPMAGARGTPAMDLDVAPAREYSRQPLHSVAYPLNKTPPLTNLSKIAMLGNHLPRKCGIATFTADLSKAITTEFSALECLVLAMNDDGRQYAYPPQVRFEIAAAELASYQRAAAFLERSSVDLVSLQHEYGIFGGEAGNHILSILRCLRVPIVTTLHTILANPNSSQRQTMDELTRLSERLVVMSNDGARLLREVHGVPSAKIDVIPHGIPSLPSAKLSKNRLKVEGKKVILTFGLLSPGKGIEHVIDALPAVLTQHPDAIYIVLGATHPHVVEHHGEEYRDMLENRAQRLGVSASVVFDNRFVSHEELTEFLAAADIYITPYLNPEQITSGTLAYAVGSGKAVVSTPYTYARELLADGRGIIVPWPQEAPRAIEQAIIGLLGDDKRRAAICQRGAAYGRSMLWPAVARSYVETFERARGEHAHRSWVAFRAQAPAEQPLGLPDVDLGHLRRLTDHTGIVQHAVFGVPRYEDGYCLDDNARALLLTALLEDAGVLDGKVVRDLASRYLAFVSHSFDADSGRFRNFMSYSRQWIEERGSEDCQGRAIWALGSVVGRSRDPGQGGLADSLFHAALPALENFTSPRAWAYALLGIDEYLRAFLGDRDVQAIRKQLAERLFELYLRASSAAWPWFEVRATYCNARLSQALLLSGARMNHEEMKVAGLRSLEWLCEVQCPPKGDGYFAPIGTNGFYEKDGAKAAFDQQPVEACATLSACLAAQRVTGDERWMQGARRAFDWFLGQNQLQQPLFDPVTGGCRDGLHADRRNENQGAESTLSFLIALAEMRAADQAAQSKQSNDSKAVS